MRILLLYLGVINVITFFLYGFDKWRAIRGGRRVPERVLLGLAGLGGSGGALLSMLLFRHKIRKVKFYLGVPILLIVQLLLILKME